MPKMLKKILFFDYLEVINNFSKKTLVNFAKKKPVNIFYEIQRYFLAIEKKKNSIINIVPIKKDENFKYNPK